MGNYEKCLKGTTYNDTNVKAGEVYRYRVRPYYWSSTHKVKYGEYTKYVGIRADKRQNIFQQ